MEKLLGNCAYLKGLAEERNRARNGVVLSCHVDVSQWLGKSADDEKEKKKKLRSFHVSASLSVLFLSLLSLSLPLYLSLLPFCSCIIFSFYFCGDMEGDEDLLPPQARLPVTGPALEDMNFLLFISMV